LVMSDSEHSTVIYTSVSIPVEDDSDMGSPRVDGPPSPDYVSGPKEPEQAIPSSNYVPGLEEPEQAIPSSNYVPGLEEPEQAPPSLDDVFPVEEQPLHAAASPTAESPGYIPESDLEEEDSEDDDEDEDEEEEEEHPAPADSVLP
ncbi:hypothetical protein Tco_0171435, partial [Tanacetum coccineum]